ncbi:MAG TPA: hypothetical protein GX513_05220 [Firmicutes bacterium]|nr:hypothetical protein [Bacillota bacterium]
MAGLGNLFWARRVAVVGASATPGKTGHTILRNIVEGGFQGEAIPVNPRGGEILGRRAYASLADVPGQVDLVVLVIPAAGVPAVLEQAAAKGARGAVVVSGGFREAGQAELEQELVRVAKVGGIRVIGPNCQGLNYAPNHLCASWPLISREGPIAVISQSGTVGAAVAGWADEEGLGISGFVALGNRCDINEVELAEFFGQDNSTRAIALYVEGVADGRRFLEVARRLAGKKGLVVLSPGRTEKGARAAQSHTRSLAGSREVLSGICRQVRAVEAQDTEQLYDFAKAFALVKGAVGRRLMVVTSSGGSGILATDLAEMSGLRVFDLGLGMKESPLLGAGGPAGSQGHVFLRSVSRISHASGDVTLGRLPARRGRELGFNKHWKLPYRWNVYGLPGAVSKHRWLHEHLDRARAYAEGCPFNRFDLAPGAELGIVTSGVAASYVREALVHLGISAHLLVLGLVHPLPERLVKELLSASRRVLVVEEGDMAVETQLRLLAQ